MTQELRGVTRELAEFRSREQQELGETTQ